MGSGALALQLALRVSIVVRQQNSEVVSWCPVQGAAACIEEPQGRQVPARWSRRRNRTRRWGSSGTGVRWGGPHSWSRLGSGRCPGCSAP